MPIPKDQEDTPLTGHEEPMTTEKEFPDENDVSQQNSRYQSGTSTIRGSPKI